MKIVLLIILLFTLKCHAQYYVYKMDMQVIQVLSDSTKTSCEQVIWGIKTDSVCFYFDYQLLQFTLWQATLKDNEHDRQVQRKFDLYDIEMTSKGFQSFLMKDVWNDKYVISFYIGENGMLILITQIDPNHLPGYVLSINKDNICNKQK